MYFSIEKDKQFPCFCRACLLGKDEAEMGNQRLCIECQSYITDEDTLRHPESHYGSDTGCTKTPDRNGHTGEAKEVLAHTGMEEGDAHQNSTKDAVTQRGGKHKKDIPSELVRELSQEGQSTRRIAKELKQQGQTISAMTVSRVLSGQTKG